MRGDRESLGGRSGNPPGLVGKGKDRYRTQFRVVLGIGPSWGTLFLVHRKGGLRMGVGVMNGMRDCANSPRKKKQSNKITNSTHWFEESRGKDGGYCERGNAQQNVLVSCKAGR